MNPIRAVIVDDEKPARDRIRRLLADHADFAIAGEAADTATAVSLIDRERPELCFLDVQIPGGDGFEVLRQASHKPHVIFTTAYDQYAVQAFEVNSLDYLLKPFDRRRFAAALGRARDAIRQGGPSPGPDLVPLLEEIRAGLQGAASPASPAQPETGPPRIAGRRGGKIVLLDPREILWFEAEDTLVFGRTREGRYLVGRTLFELESWLEPAGFFRSHRRYLVNLSHAGEILPSDEGNYRIMMRDEARSGVPLSRRQARRLRARFPW